MDYIHQNGSHTPVWPSHKEPEKRKDVITHYSLDCYVLTNAGSDCPHSLLFLSFFVLFVCLSGAGCQVGSRNANDLARSMGTKQLRCSSYR